MKKQHIILTCLLVLICGTATAQFNKALPNARGNGQVNDAKVNIGLLGGGNFTHWQHFVSSQASDWYLASYKPTLRFGYFGGIAVEYMWKNDLSFGLNVIYEQHNVGLNYLNENFPTNLNHHIKNSTYRWYWQWKILCLPTAQRAWHRCVRLRCRGKKADA